MTTKVTVFAAHGWPVDVTSITPTGARYPAIRVQPGETRDFYVHSTEDLMIHEVQPDELASEAIPNMQTL